LPALASALTSGPSVAIAMVLSPAGAAVAAAFVFLVAGFLFLFSLPPLASASLPSAAASAVRLVPAAMQAGVPEWYQTRHGSRSSPV
jgi:hypothetical protein